MRDMKQTEQQLSELATRIDPLAFRSMGDLALDDRRRAASQTAAKFAGRTQTYVGMLAGVSVMLIFIVWLYSAS